MGSEHMEVRTLDKNWKMRRAGDIEWQEAVVPGSVYTDLLQNHRMEDPYWKDNEDRICALMEEEYEYICTFEGQNTEGYSEVFLRFEGLDTLAEIFLNDRPVGKAYNMHRTWEFDVCSLLRRDEENVLRIRFGSPLKYIAQAHQIYGNIGNEDTYEGFMHLRKAHYMFGWDWGAHLPDAGIFRPVRLCKVTKGRIDSVRISQTHRDGCCILDFEAEYVADEPENCRLRIRVTAPEEGQAGTMEASGNAQDGSKDLSGYVQSKTAKRSENCQAGNRALQERKQYETILSPEGTGRIVIEDPRLWWVNGLGGQPLYEVEAILLCNDVQADVWTRRIGLRSMTVQRTKDAWGESFAHVINGKPFFAMGADYIPEEHLLGKRSPERTRRLLMDCRLANFNVIRVWGGGFYPDDWFYDLCDELGLAVWQDFMFACSVYELTPEFEENITREFIDNVKRIRHHACLALWCGNNEMEMFVDRRCWVTKPTEVRDYLFMYERIIPGILKQYDPQTFYWPASPSSGGSFDSPNDPDRGDVHYWEVWHGNKPFSEYRKYYFRYVSEFGFQSFPCKKTIETFTDDPRDWNIFSYIMEKHQRNYGANGKIMNYLQQTYRYPTSFTDVLYASQLLQAEAIRYGVEHFRRNRGRCMGAIYWQLNDCWPVISWSSIDYCGRWKALHYYAKRFFAPILVSCEEESWLTQEANMNRQHFTFEKSIRLNVANETLKDTQVLVRWNLRNAFGESLREEQEEATVPALSAVWLEKTELPEVDVFTRYVSFEAWIDGEMVSEGTVIFSYPKYFRYEDPRLSLETDGTYITVTAAAYAKSVEIQNEAEDLVLSDNYFDLNGGSRTVEILRGEAKGLRVRSVYDF